MSKPITTALTPKTPTTGVTTWTFENLPVRQVFIGEEPWFVGKDVCQILGYTNPRKALSDHVDAEDKTDGVTIRDSIGRNQRPVVINESGIYALIFGSKLPAAKAFKRWVTSVVLPSIRKNGMFASPEVLDRMFHDPQFLYSMARGYCKMTQKVVTMQKQMENMVESPKAMTLRLSGQIPADPKEPVLYSTRMIAALFGRSPAWLNTVLEMQGVQHKCEDGVWRLNEDIASKGFRQDSTYRTRRMRHPVNTSGWTESGKQFIIALLTAKGYQLIAEQ